MKPLSGRTILDCSALLPGPFVGKLLAQLGARVIKIESPERPDPAREMGPYYDELNGEKEIQSLSLLRERDKFHALVREAHGLIEGFRPAAKKKLGLDEATLHSVNPRLCIASLVGYPESGPWRDRAGHDLNFQAVTGALSLSEGMPGLPLADLFSAYDSALKLTAMIDSAARTGKGLRMAISMSATLKAVQGIYFAEYRLTEKPPKPGSNLITGKFPCYSIYGTADGRKIAVGAIEAKFWDKLCEVVGKPKLKGLGMATGAKGKRVRSELARALKAKRWSWWKPRFEAADCCVEPVLDYSEVLKLDGV